MIEGAATGMLMRSELGAPGLPWLGTPDLTIIVAGTLTRACLELDSIADLAVQLVGPEPPDA